MLRPFFFLFIFSFNLFAEPSLLKGICSKVKKEQTGLSIDLESCQKGKVYSNEYSEVNQLYGVSFSLDASNLLICQINLDNNTIQYEDFSEKDEDADRVSTCNRYFIPGKNKLTNEEKNIFCQKLTEGYNLADGDTLRLEKCLAIPVFVESTKSDNIKFISIIYVLYPEVGDFWSHSSYFDIKKKKFALRNEFV